MTWDAPSDSFVDSLAAQLACKPLHAWLHLCLRLTPLPCRCWVATLLLHVAAFLLCRMYAELARSIKPRYVTTVQVIQRGVTHFEQEGGLTIFLPPPRAACGQSRKPCSWRLRPSSSFSRSTSYGDHSKVRKARRPLLACLSKTSSSRPLSSPPGQQRSPVRVGPHAYRRIWLIRAMRLVKAATDCSLIAGGLVALLLGILPYLTGLATAKQ